MRLEVIPKGTKPTEDSKIYPDIEYRTITIQENDVEYRHIFEALCLVPIKRKRTTYLVWYRRRYESLDAIKFINGIPDLLQNIQFDIQNMRRNFIIPTKFGNIDSDIVIYKYKN